MNRRWKIGLCMLLLAGMLQGCAEETVIPENTTAETATPESTVPETTELHLQTEDKLVLAYEELSYSPPAEFYYDTLGRVVRKRYPAVDGETVYEYSEKGYLFREITYQYGEAMEATEYDIQGNPVARYGCYTGEDGELILELFEQIENLYDDRGRLLETTLYYAADEWGEKKCYTYYPDGGYELEYSDYYFYEGEMVPHCHRTSTYTADGKLAKIVRDLDDMAPYSSVSAYSFDEQGNYTALRWDYNYEGLVEWADRVYQNAYDAEGKLIRTEIFKRSFDGEQETPMALWQTVTREYDTAGRLILEVTEYVENGYTESNVWEYDEQGNLLYYSGRDPDPESEGVIERRCEYKPLSQVLYQAP